MMSVRPSPSPDPPKPHEGQKLAALPAIDTGGQPAWSGSRHAAAGLLGSGAAHATVAVIAQWLLGGALLQVFPPPEGTNSIELTLTMPSEASRQDEPPQVTIAAGSLEQVSELPDPTSLALHRSLDQPPPTASREPSLQPPPPASATPPPPSPRAEAEPAMPQTTPASRPPRRTEVKRAVETPAAAARASTASKQNEGVQSEAPARAVFSPQPQYPPAALAAGITGRVLVRVRIDGQGRVTDARLHRSSGHASLDAAALEAVRRWRFQPATRAGRPVETQVAVPIRFTIATN